MHQCKLQSLSYFFNDTWSTSWYKVESEEPLPIPAETLIKKKWKLESSNRAVQGKMKYTSYNKNITLKKEQNQKTLYQ